MFEPEEPRGASRPVRDDGYLPLRSYAVLGNMRASALVASDGSVDWLAMPGMDSAPICAAILDPAGGGAIELAPAVPYEVRRHYLDATMVLETVFTTEVGTVRVTDSLNRGALGELPWSELARRVHAEQGQVPMRWSVRPGHGLSGIRPWVRQEAGQIRILVGDCQLALTTAGVGSPTVSAGRVDGQFTADPAAPALLAIVATQGEPLHVPTASEIDARIGSTADSWRRWSGQIRYDGPRRHLVVRSALALKALTVTPGGAIAGAATTSLPEKLGGSRNFDYRYAWVRDASFTIDAMSQLGLSEEVHASLTWLLRSVAQQCPELRVFYSLDGHAVPADMRSAEAPGYQGSWPVHIGNSAADQRQIGCFGDLLDAVLRYVENGGRLDPGTAEMVGRFAEQVCNCWGTPDAGIWELGDSRPYTISKVGCWVALDRAIQLAGAGQLTNLHLDRWRTERDAIRAWIDANCWSDTKRSYTFYAGTDDLDAAVLLMARTGYCAGDDPRLHSTIDAIASELGVKGGTEDGDRRESPLLYRYSGQEGQEGTFTACACWMVEALTRAGRHDEAALRFEQLADLANDVGLYTEEIDPVTGEMLGNIPQALSHLAVIGAGVALGNARSAHRERKD